MTEQRKQAISRIRKKIIKQANERLKEDISRYSNQSDSEGDE